MKLNFRLTEIMKSVIKKYVYGIPGCFLIFNTVLSAYCGVAKCARQMILVFLCFVSVFLKYA